MNRYTLKYEFLNTLYNGYAFVFGTVLPIMLLHLISIGVLSTVPDEYKVEATTELFIGMSMLIPLASIFLNHAATYSNELEKNIPERIMLFGFSEKSMLLNKMLANYIFLTVCVAIYFMGTVPFIQIATPSPAAAIIFIIVIYLIAGMFMILAHGIATLIRKFGATYGVTMALYFAIMILSGDMGLPISKLPKFLRAVSDLLPTAQLSSGFVDFWLGKAYNFGPLIQSMIFFAALSFIVVLIAFKVRGRKTDGRIS